MKHTLAEMITEAPVSNGWLPALEDPRRIPKWVLIFTKLVAAVR